MKKRYVFLIIFLLLMVGLSGCTDKTSTQKSEAELKEEVKAEIKTENELNKDSLIYARGPLSDQNYYKFKSNTTVYFDIDQDGKNEEIRYDTGDLTGETEDEMFNGKLIVNSYEPLDIDVFNAETESFIIIKYTDENDTEMYMIGLFDRGPSADPVTTLYTILSSGGKKALVNVGEVNAEIIDQSDYNDPYNSYDYASGPSTEYLPYTEDFAGKAFLKEGEGIEAPISIASIIPQTWFGRSLFIYDQDAGLLLDKNKVEGKDYKTYVVLTVTKDVKAYAKKNNGSEGKIIKAGQNVLLFATDNKQWIAMEAEDGTKGWVDVTDVTPDHFEGFLVFG